MFCRHTWRQRVRTVSLMRRHRQTTVPCWLASALALALTAAKEARAGERLLQATRKALRWLDPCTHAAQCLMQTFLHQSSVALKLMKCTHHHCTQTEGAHDMQDAGEGAQRPRGDRNMEMELTFGGGLEELGQRLLSRKQERELRKKDTVWEAYERRRRSVLCLMQTYISPSHCTCRRGQRHTAGHQGSPRQYSTVLTESSQFLVEGNAVHADAELCAPTGRSGRRPRHRGDATDQTARRSASRMSAKARGWPMALPTPSSSTMTTPSMTPSSRWVQPNLQRHGHRELCYRTTACLAAFCSVSY
jgi:hypothetical protein